jgi:beta-hydroxylase
MQKTQGKRLKRIARTGAVVAVAGWLAPWPTAILVACGVVDVCRHRHITAELLEKYFTGNGIATWLLSPVNLLADLFSHRNRRPLAVDDLPAEHQQEIAACVRAFSANGERIKAYLAATAAGRKRSMLVFRWFGTAHPSGLQIPEFAARHRFIKTIAVSTFSTRERTSRHFGPLRLTFRVLYNLEIPATDDVFIEVDGEIHYWKDDPLFIFDDTRFHQSVNDRDETRYCLFMDIARPSPFPRAFDAAVRATSAIAGSFNRLFYQHWSFVR